MYQTAAFLKTGHDHSHCLTGALDRAAELCAKKGVRLTNLRRRVLELIWSGHKPIGAYELLSSLKSERLGAGPPTVYRALNFLRTQGLVHRIESLNAFVGCPDPDKPHGGQFLICKSCGLAAEIIDDTVDRAIKKCAANASFDIGRKVIEIEGLCPHCRRGGDK